MGLILNVAIYKIPHSYTSFSNLFISSNRNVNLIKIRSTHLLPIFYSFFFVARVVDHSQYFLQIRQYEPLSASTSNHRKSATYLISPLVSVCMKERPHITQTSFLICFIFGVSEVANCMFLLFHFFKRQTWAQTFFF